MTKAMAVIHVRAIKTRELLQDRREAGQGSLEYVGVVAAAAVIVGLLIVGAKSFDVSDLLGKAKTFVTGKAGI